MMPATCPVNQPGVPINELLAPGLRYFRPINIERQGLVQTEVASAVNVGAVADGVLAERWRFDIASLGKSVEADLSGNDHASPLFGGFADHAPHFVGRAS